jgi:pimeloyl-ACP methyl ester carboxylesterase
VHPHVYVDIPPTLLSTATANRSFSNHPKLATLGTNVFQVFGILLPVFNSDPSQDRRSEQPERQHSKSNHSLYSDLSAFSFEFSLPARSPDPDPSQDNSSYQPAEETQPLTDPEHQNSVQITEHHLTVDGFALTVVERRPQQVSVDTPIVYLPGYLEGLDSNEEFLQQFDDRVVYALQVSAGVNRFEAFRAVLNELMESDGTPDLVTHSMGAFVLDHDFQSHPEDADLFRKAVLITPPGFIENDSVPRLLGGYFQEVWQASFSEFENFRRNSKTNSLLGAVNYIRTGVLNTIREAFRVPRVDLTKAVGFFLEKGKELYSILTTSDKLIPGDKTKEGLLRGGLPEERIDMMIGTHIPHMHSPEATAAAVKRRLDRDSIEE